MPQIVPKARPILFSGPMVRALLAGRKTQTRRIAKHPLLDDVPSMTDVVHENPQHAAPYLDSYCGGAKTAENPRGMTEWWCWWTRDDRPGRQFKCPYGKPGDLLWCRESYAEVARFPPTYRYHATDDVHELRKKRPSIHMPRSASRITLELTGVKIERLADISEEDAKAEGASYHDGRGVGHSGWRHDLKDVHATARNSYMRLWNEINGPDADFANPLVWVLTFRVHSVNVDEFMKQVEAA